MLTNIHKFLGFGGSRKQRGGQTCPEQFAVDSSLPQGEAFLKMNQKYHGGRRTRKAMKGGAADIQAAFTPIPEDIHTRAGTAVLDQAIADLAKFTPQSQAGGAQLSGAPLDAPPMLLRPEDEPAAFLNPQWVQENVVNPNFHGPDSALVQTGAGRKAHKSRKARKSMKVGKKARKSMKGGRKSRMVCRKGRKSMKGGKKTRKGRKASKKARKTSRKH